MAVALLAGTFADGAEAHAQRRDRAAEAALSTWADAAGGRNVWDAVRTVEFTITTVWYDSAGSERRRRPRQVWIRKEPGGFRVRVERLEPEGAYVQVWDRSSGWATLNGRILPDTAQAVRELEYVAGDLSYWIGLPWKLYDPGVRIALADRDAHAPGHALHVTFARGVGLNDGDQFWYYFADPRSAFPTEVHYIEQGHPPEDRVRVRIDRWGALQRVRFIEQRTILRQDGRALRSLVVSGVRVNTRVPEKLFARPDINPVSGRSDARRDGR